METICSWYLLMLMNVCPVTVLVAVFLSRIRQMKGFGRYSEFLSLKLIWNEFYRFYWSAMMTIFVSNVKSPIKLGFHFEWDFSFLLLSTLVSKIFGIKLYLVLLNCAARIWIYSWHWWRCELLNVGKLPGKNNSKPVRLSKLLTMNLVSVSSISEIILWCMINVSATCY